MDAIQILQLIQEYTAQRCEERGLAAPKVQTRTVLLGNGLPLDSLDLATLVFELQERTGVDPFAEGFINFQTAGELANLFASPAATDPLNSHSA